MIGGNLKTLLYATGETHKLSPLSEHIVSPMLPVLNRPVMDYSIEVLTRQKVKQIDISLFEKPGEIEAYFGDGKYRGLKLDYHLQREPWGDAGSVRRTFPALNESVLCIPADILIDFDMEGILAFHNRHKSCVTILASPAFKGQSIHPSRQVPEGVRQVSDRGRLKPGRMVSTGVFLITPDLVEKIQPRKKVNLIEDLIPDLLAQGIPVFAYRFMGYWNPLETFLQYYHAQFEVCFGRNSKDMGTEPAPLKYLTIEGKRISEGVWAGRNIAVHPSVSVAPRVYLNDNCMIDKGVQIGPDVVIGRGVIIDQDATIQDALILDHTYVGRLLNVQSKIVAKNLVIDFLSGEHVLLKDESMLGATSEEHVDLGIRRWLSAALALCLTVLFFPLGLIIALLLGLSGSDVLTRKGKSHTDMRRLVQQDERAIRKFRLLQFQTHRKDGTVTWIGSLLEATQLYRLPELINVMKGDLAFVGVKPLAPEDVEKLTEEWQRVRFGVPAGMTGLWYLQTDEDALFEQVLITDAYYTATRNFAGDMRILWQTPGAWWRQVTKRMNRNQLRRRVDAVE